MPEGLVRVRLVSLLRDAVGGRGELEVPVKGEATLSDVLAELFSRYPKLESMIRELEQRGLNIVYMVNGRGAAPRDRVKPGDVVTILPPASGG